MSSPIDEALMSKEALFGSFLQGARGAFGEMSAKSVGAEMAREVPRAVGGMAAAAGFAGAAHGVGKLLGSIRKKRDFEEMMETNPDLATHQEDNPKFFNSAYTSLRGMNPTFAKDPVVAGGMMRRMMESPESAGGILASSIKSPDAPKGGGGLGIQQKLGPLTYTRQF